MQTHVSTKVAARMLNVAPQTMRAALCQKGHYLNIRPQKMPNRFLAWPVAQITRTLNGEGK